MWRRALRCSPAIATSPTMEVAVDSASPAEQIPGPVLQAQTVLIKAAKQEVTAPTLETLAQLRAANDAFNAACRQEHSTP
jgi:hypothetical protein